MNQDGMELWLFALLGAIFGSFNSLLIHRLPHDESIIFTRSACPKCGNKLQPRDLIPIISWLISLAKCRFCSTKISMRYPLLEIATSCLFMFIYSLHGFSLNSLLLCLLASHLLVLCVIDLQWRIIPDILQIIVAGLGFCYQLHNQQHIADILAGGLVGYLLGLLMQKAIKLWKKKDGLGMGDVKFMAVSGIWLGSYNLIPYYFYAGVFGVVTACLWRFCSKDPRFPFGPALALSLLLLVLHSGAAEWYLQLSVNIVTIVGLI
jgi:prepilin signal peptidase PulO-like enzyme (type II secretory pathway)